jgi:hypothetical protein
MLVDEKMQACLAFAMGRESRDALACIYACQMQHFEFIGITGLTTT